MRESHFTYTGLFNVKYQLEKTREPFTREAVLQLPKNRCGLYAIWLATDLVAGEAVYERLYAGISTTCVRRRLLQHLSNEENPQLRTELRMFGEFVYFSFAFTEDPAETLELETALIREWQPVTNRYKLG